MTKNPEYTVSEVTSTFGVSRQSFYKNKIGNVRCFYHRKEDAKLLELILVLLSQRATYGYKRVTAMLNRERKNGEKVYVAFSLDCCDRESIAYVAESRPLLAQDIQDLMILSVEKRFGFNSEGQIRAPYPIQWLSDRGAIYRARETIMMSSQLGMQSCFTAAF